MIASENTDLTNPANNATYMTARNTQRAAAQQAIDNQLTRGTPDPADDVEAILTPAGQLTGIGARAGYPQIVIPAGYGTGRDPVGIAFNGTAYSEAKLLAFGYAYEQATKLRKPPSEINPSLWRCVPGNAYVVTPRRVRAERARQRGRDRRRRSAAPCRRRCRSRSARRRASGRSRRASSAPIRRRRPPT